MTKESLSAQLLNWYQQNGRSLPWRHKGGAHPDPYAVLVSEFMLQQTGVKTVIPYFQKFMERFPQIEDLANATQEEVYLYWQGLGYYSRARALHATAQKIVHELLGSFPQNRKDVLKLKGIGPYTASSFLALAFNKAETVIDGNVIRVICRMYHLTQPITEIMDEIYQKASQLTDQKSPADYASAIMDLGAMICTPKNPQCLLCPWQKSCLSTGKTDLEKIPQKAKLAKKEKQGSVYIIRNGKGEIFIRKRTEKGLLAGLYEFPWCEEGQICMEALPQDSGKKVTHVFSHFKLILSIYFVNTEKQLTNGFFIPEAKLANYPFSTLMKKVYNKIKAP